MREERWVDRFLYVWNDIPYYTGIEYYSPSSNDFLSLLDDLVQSRIRREGLWWVCFPEYLSIRQGWKIHVSATLRNAQNLLKTVACYLSEKTTTFKFALDLNILELLNSKAVSCGSAGKFITIYPNFIPTQPSNFD